MRRSSLSPCANGIRNATRGSSCSAAFLMRTHIQDSILQFLSVIAFIMQVRFENACYWSITTLLCTVSSREGGRCDFSPDHAFWPVPGRQWTIASCDTGTDRLYACSRQAMPVPALSGCADTGSGGYGHLQSLLTGFTPTGCDLYQSGGRDCGSKRTQWAERGDDRSRLCFPEGGQLHHHALGAKLH